MIQIDVKRINNILKDINNEIKYIVVEHDGVRVILSRPIYWYKHLNIMDELSSFINLITFFDAEILPGEDYGYETLGGFFISEKRKPIKTI